MTGYVLIGLIGFLAGIFIGVGLSGELMKDRIKAGVFAYEGSAYTIAPVKAPNYFTNGE